MTVPAIDWHQVACIIIYTLSHRVTYSLTKTVNTWSSHENESYEANFRTSNVAIVRQCQERFGFQLPSITLCKRVDKFVGKYYASDNLLCKICSKFV